jgi:hypothetical protein
MLQQHPNRLAVALLLDMIRNGANVCYVGDRADHHIHPNHQSSLSNPSFINDEIKSDIDKGRTAGWFNVQPYNNMRTSPMGCVPKTLNGIQIGLRKIMDASYPAGDSLNDFIIQLHSTVTSWHMVLDKLYTAGRGTLLFKRDIKSAFRTILIREADRPLHGIYWNNQWAYELSGVRSSPPLWNRIGNAICWIANHIGIQMVHYVDDYLGICPPGTDANSLMKLFDDTVINTLGPLLANDKKEGPTHKLVYTGIEIDMTQMTVAITAERTQEIHKLLIDACRPSRQTMSYRKLASLIGKLVFISRVMPAGRAFYNIANRALATRTNNRGSIKFNASIRFDLNWWINFLTRDFNGIGLISPQHWTTNAVVGERFIVMNGCMEHGVMMNIKKHMFIINIPCHIMSYMQ